LDGHRDADFGLRGWKFQTEQKFRMMMTIGEINQRDYSNSGGAEDGCRQLKLRLKEILIWKLFRTSDSFACPVSLTEQPWFFSRVSIPFTWNLGNALVEKG
jgi:hypothetical protein